MRVGGGRQRGEGMRRPERSGGERGGHKEKEGSLLFLPSAARKRSTPELPLGVIASERVRLCWGATPSLGSGDTRVEMVVKRDKI